MRMEVEQASLWMEKYPCILRRKLSGEKSSSLAGSVSILAYQAMLQEVFLTPKPGLVDAYNTGSHHDMTLGTFRSSAAALFPYFAQFVLCGESYSGYPIDKLLTLLRPIGGEAEDAMFYATQGVNTHKGMIFNLGIICGVIGWLNGRGQQIDLASIQSATRHCCLHLTDELKCAQDKFIKTAGEKIYLRYGITGARGEAESGFSTVINHALPAYQKWLQQGKSSKEALLLTLILLMAINNDSNILSRGGVQGLDFVKKRARELLILQDESQELLEAHLGSLDREFIRKNLSPGGSADLLSLTWFLNQVTMMTSDIL